LSAAHHAAAAGALDRRSCVDYLEFLDRRVQSVRARIVPGGE